MGGNKETSSAYDIKVKEKTPSTSKKKEKSSGGYVCMYRCGNNLLYSKYEHMCASQETTITVIKLILDI